MRRENSPAASAAVSDGQQQAAAQQPAASAGCAGMAAAAVCSLQSRQRLGCKRKQPQQACRERGRRCSAGGAAEVGVPLGVRGVLRLSWCSSPHSMHSCVRATPQLHDCCRDAPDASARDHKHATTLLRTAAGLVSSGSGPDALLPVPGFPELSFARNGSAAALRELAKSYQVWVSVCVGVCLCLCVRACCVAARWQPHASVLPDASAHHVPPACRSAPSNPHRLPASAQRGVGVEVSHRLSLELFRRAAELGDPQAHGAMGMRMAWGLHHPYSFEGASIRLFGPVRVSCAACLRARPPRSRPSECVQPPRLGHALPSFAASAAAAQPPVPPAAACVCHSPTRQGPCCTTTLAQRAATRFRRRRWATATPMASACPGAAGRRSHTTSAARVCVCVCVWACVCVRVRACGRARACVLLARRHMRRWLPWQLDLPHALARLYAPDTSQLRRAPTPDP
jgi:hypothetical protein